MYFYEEKFYSGRVFLDLSRNIVVVVSSSSSWTSASTVAAKSFAAASCLGKKIGGGCAVTGSAPPRSKLDSAGPGKGSFRVADKMGTCSGSLPVTSPAAKNKRFFY